MTSLTFLVGKVPFLRREVPNHAQPEFSDLELQSKTYFSSIKRGKVEGIGARLVGFSRIKSLQQLILKPWSSGQPKQKQIFEGGEDEPIEVLLF